MITFKNLSLKFTKEFYALYDINLESKKGEAVSIFGVEHRGQATFLRVWC